MALLAVPILANNVLEFPNADIYYPEGYEKVAVYIGNTFESIRPKAVELVGNDPGRIKHRPRRFWDKHQWTGSSPEP